MESERMTSSMEKEFLLHLVEFRGSGYWENGKRIQFDDAEGDF